jgi:Beta-L-arabinofuranosidase, GH127
LIRHAACVALAFAICLQARSAHPEAEEAPDVFVPVPLDQQHLAGILSVRMRANSEGYLEHVDLQQLLADPISAGLFLIASSNSYAYSEDPQLKKVMDRVARTLIKNTPETDNPRAQASLLSGLVAYAEETGDEDASVAARKLAGTFLSQPAALMVGPLVNLYRATDDDRYLQAARTAARKTPANNDIDRQVFFSGLVTYYRQTGDDAALKKSAQAWKAVHPTPTGAPDQTGDTCASAAWFEWTGNLLRATGQIEYAEALETTLYNQLLAAQEPQSGSVYGVIPAAGEKQVLAGTSNCSAAEGWALSFLPDAIWGRLNNGIVLFNYSPGRASFRLRRRTTIQIYAESNYPQTGEITLHIEPSRDTRFHLQLRVPRWAREFTAESGETRLAGTPGSFLNLVRNWKKGDIVKIRIEPAVAYVSDPEHPANIALQRGPQVLALTARRNPGTDLTSAAWSGNSTDSLKATAETHGPPESMFDQVFQTKGSSIAGKPEPLVLVPFADAVGPYRIWLSKR